MWFLRNGDEEEEPELMHISSRVDKSWIADQLRVLLAQYGVVYEDTKPEEKRADMDFLHRFRLSCERTKAVIATALLRATIVGVLTIIGWALVAYFNIIPPK